ncbi:hypothetical protein BDW22DRAFT_990646 [Trametopsis cervina]|nr:hypothetical protein BDW22DRAFT_990646 [Trametopsis cervina]
MSEHSEDDENEVYAYDSDDPAGEENYDSDYDTPALQPAKGKQRTSDLDTVSLSFDALQDMINGDTRRVANITGLKPAIAAILLQHFRWNEERLLEQYMDSPGDVLRASGEPQNVEHEPFTDNYDGTPPASKRARLDSPMANREAFDCPICCESLPSTDGTFKLRCGHRFCDNCWLEYATTKIKGEGQSFFKCMQDGCATTMDEASLERLAPYLLDRHKSLVQQSYVQSTTKLRFCPHPGCSQTIFCSSGRGESMFSNIVPSVRCDEGHVFCFGCGNVDDHRPLLCKFVAIWNKSSRDDAGTSQWLRANTKDCPKCQNKIEKAGGCNRIHCRHCNHEFCWMCMENWATHGYNNASCNAFVEPKPDAASNEARRNLERWLFYFDRFNNHELSAELDQELVERTEHRMLEAQETSGISWIEAKFMSQAVEELTRCRLTLKWSYAMAYFMAKGNEKEIFEDLQSDLEKAVEQLSEMLDEEVDAQTLKGLRERMINKTVYVRQRHEIMLRDTEEGLKEERWVWTQ